MDIYKKAVGRDFALAIVLVGGALVAFSVILEGDMVFSPAYLLVIAYLLWMGDRGNYYYLIGAIATALMALGFILTTSPEFRNLNLLYFNLLMVILVWIVIYLVYQQKNLVGRMEKNNEQLNSMFENATEGILLVNDKGKIVILNQFAEKLFGYGRRELLGHSVEKLIPGRFSEAHTSHRNAYLKNPHNRSMGSENELFALHKEGREFPVEVSLSHYTVKGRQTVIVFVNDISNSKKVKQQLVLEKELTQKLNEELEAQVLERTRKLEEALSNLEKSNKSLQETEKHLSKSLNKERELGELKSRFVSTASHEFRTPLTTILSSVFLLENTRDENHPRFSNVYLTRIRKSVKHLTAILNDILSLSQLEEGKLKPFYSITDIDLLIHEIIEELSVFKHPDQRVIYEKSEIIGFQKIDKKFLKIVLLNLLSNSIKFSPVNGSIKLLTCIEKKQLIISITDNGIGIPLEEQKHIFDRFFRANNTKNIEGTGLGLNIAKKYIDLMNGTISFKSGVNEGATFTISIPIHNHVETSNKKIKK